MMTLKAASSLAGVTPIASLSWDQARADYQAKRAYSDALPENASDEDEAVDAYCVAMDVLIENVSAPDPRALAEKLELALARADWSVSMLFPDHEASIAVDFYRLSGIDPLRSTAEAWVDRWLALGGDFGTRYDREGRPEGIMRGMRMSYFWAPPKEQNPALRPHEWIVEEKHHDGAVKVLEGLLTLIPGLIESVREVAFDQGLVQRLHGAE